MYKQLFIFICVIAISFSAVAPRVQAVDFSDALTRMNTIIAEMKALQAEFAALSASVNGSSPTPSVLGASSVDVFTQSLEYGDTNDDIKKIQKLLATDATIYPYGVASGFFGPKTQEAIRNFQARFGLDTVGVVGPATRSLLSLFIAAYPSGNYPADVLQKKPSATPVVQGASTSNTGTNPARLITVELDQGEAEVDIYYTNGNKNTIFVFADTESQVVTAIAGRTTLTQAQIRAVLDFEEESNSSSDVDEGDAEDMIEDAEDAIDDAADAIEEAEDDGDDVDWAEDTLEEAEDLLEEAEDAFDDEDYDEAYELAEEAIELAEEAEDRIDEEENGQQGDSDDIDSIEAEVVDEDETEVTVEYEDGTEYEFTVEEDKKDEIIEEIADELDMDEDDVEDLIEFDYGDVDEIEVLIDEDEGEARVDITFESGVTMRLNLDEDDEDDIIEAIAEELDMDEDDVEDVIDFDYN